MEIYLTAIHKQDVACLKAPDRESDAWRKEAEEIGEERMRAMENLKAHRQEHGC
jgi:hypothetical protein